ncbi:MAG: hypothetical protein MJ187_04485 [Alphaproteobacteria bacterium]|nr:hypothetical protein [Alphaproteobacteria bacterium]
MDKICTSRAQNINNFVINRSAAFDLLDRMLGCVDHDKFVYAIGPGGLNTILDGIAMAIDENPIYQRVMECKNNDLEIQNIYFDAIEKQKNIKSKYYSEDKLKELAKQIYAASYGFIENKHELKDMLRYAHNDINKYQNFVRPVMKNLCDAFNIPEPNIVFLNITGFCHGLHLPNCVVMSMDDDIMGLITHEFVHHLQRFYKTSAGIDGISQSRKYSIVRKFLCGVNCGKYTDLIKQIYTNSVIESEAIFIAECVYKMHCINSRADIAPVLGILKNAQKAK